jgi:hypothetical protein
MNWPKSGPRNAQSRACENAEPIGTRVEERVFTPGEIERRRKQLLKAISAFEKMIRNLAASPKAMSNRLAAQTAFIINLMLFACTKDHRKPDGSSVRLMAFAPGSSGDRELTFAVRAGRLLQQVWVGGRGGAVVDQLFVDSRHSSMPDDVFFLIVMSRWAMLGRSLPHPPRLRATNLRRFSKQQWSRSTSLRYDTAR